MRFNYFLQFLPLFRFRWPQYFLRVAQYVRAHRHVLLLHGVGDGTQIPKIHLVEEVPNLVPNGKKSNFFELRVGGGGERKLLKKKKK